MKSIDILKAISNIDEKYIKEAMPSVYKEEKKSFLNIRMLASVFCVLLLAIVGINLIKTINNNAITSETAEYSEDAAVGNPYLEVNSLSEAEDMVGFKYNVPDLDYEKTYIVVDSYILQVNYLENDETIFTLRKAYGDEDISGVYLEYEGTELLTVNNIEVMAYGAPDGTLIRFRKDGYFYSIYSQDKNNENKAIEIATYIIENN